MKTSLQSIFAWVSLLCCASVQSLEFDVQTIPLDPDQQVTFLPYLDAAALEPVLVVIETPDMSERERQLQGLTAEPVRRLSLYRRNGHGWVLELREELTRTMDIMGIVRTHTGARLAGYGQSEFSMLSPASGEFEPIMAVRSMYVGNSWEPLPGIEMFVDLNNDGLDDFLLPGFEGWQVALQQEAGFSTHQTIGPGPRLDFGETADLVGYQAEPAHLLDENLDGYQDLAFWLNGRFEVYLQQPDYSFSAEPRILDPDLRDVLGSFMSVEFGEEEGDDPQQRMLDAVGDIDGDGLADVIIQSVEGDGIFGLETSYQIHRGYQDSAGRLSFEKQASSVVGSDGIQIENDRMDLTGDGRQEFVVTSVEITLGAIISALITRSASVDVDIYRMNGDVFADKPNLTKKIKVRFDFGEGDLFIPAVLSADLDGDGRQDLLIQKDEKTLLVYAGEPTDRLFQKNPIRLQLELPKDRGGFMVKDLDRDGQDELILHVVREEESRLSVVDFET